MINKESYKNLFASVKRMALLRFEGLRLGAVDKATVLLSTIALVIVAFILVSAALLFFCNGPHILAVDSHFHGLGVPHRGGDIPRPSRGHIPCTPQTGV